MTKDKHKKTSAGDSYLGGDVLVAFSQSHDKACSAVIRFDGSRQSMVSKRSNAPGGKLEGINMKISIG